MHISGDNNPIKWDQKPAETKKQSKLAKLISKGSKAIGRVFSGKSEASEEKIHTIDKRSLDQAMIQQGKTKAGFSGNEVQNLVGNLSTQAQQVKQEMKTLKEQIDREGGQIPPATQRVISNRMEGIRGKIEGSNEKEIGALKEQYNSIIALLPRNMHMERMT